MIHTGQHYDHNMSKVFFDDLDLPEPDIFLGIGPGSHGEQTGKAIIETEKYLKKSRPDAICVVGDTNAGLSGALAACKLGIPVVHYEAGARSHDWYMPEEINRIITDSISDFCFCPTETSASYLRKSGISDSKIFVVGNTIVDSIKINLDKFKYIEIHKKFSLDKILNSFNPCIPVYMFLYMPFNDSILTIPNFLFIGFKYNS